MHPQVLKNIARLPPARAKRTLKYWYTRADIDRIYREAKELYPNEPQVGKYDIFDPLLLKRHRG